MKWIALILLPAMAGCQGAIGALNKTQQPKFKEVPYLMDISGAQEITIKSPQQVEYDEQGRIKKISPVLDQKGKPILASFRIKDQTFEQPKGIWDWAGTLTRGLLAYFLGKEAFDVIGTGIKGMRDLGRQTPTIVDQQKVGVVTVADRPSQSHDVQTFTFE